jgi:hypothetical protein
MLAFDHAGCDAGAARLVRCCYSAGSGSRTFADRTEADTADCGLCCIVRPRKRGLRGRPAGRPRAGASSLSRRSVYRRSRPSPVHPGVSPSVRRCRPSAALQAFEPTVVGLQALELAEPSASFRSLLLRLLRQISDRTGLCRREPYD